MRSSSKRVGGERCRRGQPDRPGPPGERVQVTRQGRRSGHGAPVLRRHQTAPPAAPPSPRSTTIGTQTGRPLSCSAGVNSPLVFFVASALLSSAVGGETDSETLGEGRALALAFTLAFAFARAFAAARAEGGLGVGAAVVAVVAALFGPAPLAGSAAFVGSDPPPPLPPLPPEPPLDALGGAFVSFGVGVGCLVHRGDTWRVGSTTVLP